jgi:hypothetical protein
LGALIEKHAVRANAGGQTVLAVKKKFNQNCLGADVVDNSNGSAGFVFKRILAYATLSLALSKLIEPKV